MKYSELPVKKIKYTDVPFYHRHASRHSNALIELGPVKVGGNEPYCYTEEKQCQNHICRVLGNTEKIYDSALVVRDDGTVWKIWLSNFQEAYRLEIEVEPNESLCSNS